ncbi:MAG: HAD hydrolase-like protein [Sphaerochaetaceae bacterium]|nr:HAD hydrolase-like protein [Sphaerochaetaceae bacterium]
MKGIVFDLDGTLAYTLGDIQAALNHAMKTMGYQGVDIGLVRSVVGNGLRNALERCMDSLGASYSKSLIDKGMKSLEAYYNAHFCDQTRLYDGMGDLVARLKQEGCALGVLSNKKEELAIKVIDILFPSRPFAFVAGQGGRYPNKPDCSGLVDFCTQNDVKLEDFMYIGDSEVDFQTAQNMSASVVLVSWGYRDEAYLRAFTQDIAHDAGQLAEMISRRLS